MWLISTGHTWRAMSRMVAPNPGEGRRQGSSGGRDAHAQAEDFVPVGAAAAAPQFSGAVAVGGGAIALQAAVGSLLHHQRAFGIVGERHVVEHQERGAARCPDSGRAHSPGWRLACALRPAVPIRCGSCAHSPPRAATAAPAGSRWRSGRRPTAPCRATAPADGCAGARRPARPRRPEMTSASALASQEMEAS